jgi:hypothetical protein
MRIGIEGYTREAQGVTLSKSVKCRAESRLFGQNLQIVASQSDLGDSLHAEERLRSMQLVRLSMRLLLLKSRNLLFRATRAEIVRFGKQDPMSSLQ